MTFQAFVEGPNGSKVKIRGLLDSASSASFVSERLACSLNLPRSHHNITISGIAGLSNHSPLRSVATMNITSIHPNKDTISISAIVIPQVTCDLPTHPVSHKSNWTHLSNLLLADPEFGTPGKIDLLLGVDVFADVMLHGRRSGPPDSPTAFETMFGWVISGKASSLASLPIITSHHVSTMLYSDDTLRKFWEIEDQPGNETSWTITEKEVVKYFEQTHHQNSDGRFIVPLLKRSDVIQLGESRSHAVRRFMYLEQSLKRKGQSQQFTSVIEEYFNLGHAEPVPDKDLNKPESTVFYLPVHVVYKETSSTTKIRAVFDASAKTTTGVSLNDQLLVGPTVHSPLVDVLLRFRSKRIAVTTDVSKMYRAIELVKSDRDLHRFVWRANLSDTLKDYRMTRVTFGVSASSFVANMCIKRNAMNLAEEYPLAAEAVAESFYVDDGLTGADNVESAIRLQKQLNCLFSKGGFSLHKWNSNNRTVLEQIKPELRDPNTIHQLINKDQELTRTLGLRWETNSDVFRVAISQMPRTDKFTKRALISDIARIYDVLGWFSPTVVKMKILFQRLWEQKIDWDDLVPKNVQDVWVRWRSELPRLMEKTIPRCYHPPEVNISAQQLHGFSDASEEAYSAVVYLRLVDSEENIHIALVASKTKVSPVKRLTIPRLELCGALLLSRLLQHVMSALKVPMQEVHAWTDSTIVLNWLTGNPRRFKTFVGNRVAEFIDAVSPGCWKHVAGADNPADCASRGLYPSELFHHELWWCGPDWLRDTSANWPVQQSPPPEELLEDLTTEMCHTVMATSKTKPSLIVPAERYSSFERIRRVIAWMMRFIEHCRNRNKCSFNYLTTSELLQAEIHVFTVVQDQQFPLMKDFLKQPEQTIPKGNCLLPLSPFVDSDGLIRVGGRQQLAHLSFSRIHPIILHGNHYITKLLIVSEHKRLLHGGATIVLSSLNRRFHIIRGRSIVRSIIRQCITCRRLTVKPKPPLMGQLPLERVTPGTVFEKTGIDYAGPLYTKYGHVRKPIIVKSYVAVFVSLNVKAVHLELVSDLTAEGFISCLRRFIARRGLPSLLWSDHGTNFIGADREMKELINLLKNKQANGQISEFCTLNHIQWKHIPEHSPHFGGIWEAAVKSFKKHLNCIVGNTRLTFEEMYTVLSQIEACLNSRPLVACENTDDGVDALTPGHFLIGKPLMSLPDDIFSSNDNSYTLLRRWQLCQSVVKHLRKRWSLEYLTTLQKKYKWNRSSRNLSEDDVVILIEDNMIPTQWPLARVVKTYFGSDGVVRVVDVKTSKGCYRRPVTKIAVLLPKSNDFSN